MSLARLALRNIAGRPLRSWLIALAALVLAGSATATLLLVRAAGASLRLAQERLGADIVVVPSGAQPAVEAALVMGAPMSTWMPEDNVQRIAAIPGVAAVSPQLYLRSLQSAACCTVSEMFLVAYDPATDFTLRPWLRSHVPQGLALGDAIGGSSVFVPEGDESILVYGYPLRLIGNLEPTGTNLDRSLFFTFETAHAIARRSDTAAVRPLQLPVAGISAALVRVRPGSDAHAVALEVLRQVPGAAPVESADLFRGFRLQIEGLQQMMLAILAVAAAVLLALSALVLALATGERRREVGVLRALGATRWAVCRVLLAEAALTGLAGAGAGAALACLATWLFRDLIASLLGLPLFLPPPPSLVAPVAAGLALALGAVAAGALGPALHACRQDPALAMRE